MPDARELLDAERRRVVHRLASLAGDLDEVVAASRDTNADDEHDPEGATIAFERSQVSSLAREMRRHLAEVDAAIARLDVGTYGTCEGCREPIPPARLEAKPSARRCVACAASVHTF